MASTSLLDCLLELKTGPVNVAQHILHVGKIKFKCFNFLAL